MSCLHKVARSRETETRVNHLWGKDGTTDELGKIRLKPKKAGVSKRVTRKLAKRREEVGYSGTWPEYWENREQFHNISMSPTSYSVPEKRKCAWEGWFIGQLSLSALCSLNVDSREVNWIIFVEFSGWASSQGYTTFQLLMRQLYFLSAQQL